MSFDVQFQFSAGELSPETTGRKDLEKAQGAVDLLQNFYVKPHGPAVNREGLRHVNFAYDSSNEVRLIPFQFNTDQTYILEFGEQYMRVFKDGGLVLDPNGASISDATQASPVTVTTSSSHGYSNDDWVFIQNVSGMTEINNRFFIIKNVTSTTFDLYDMYGNAVDGTGFSAYSSGGNAFVVPVFTTVYSASDLNEIRYTQSNDVMTLAHPDYDVQELTRSDHHVWTFSVPSFNPNISAPTGVTASVASGSGSTTYTYLVTSISADNGEESLRSSEDSVENDLTQSGNENSISWNSVADALEYNVYKEDNGLFGFIGTTRDTSFIDDRIEPDLTDTPPDANDPFSASNTNPATATYHQQRIVYGRANTDPQRIWSSQVGAFTNFTSTKPPQDDDAFSFVLNATEVNAIQHLLSLNELLIFTSGGEWIGTGGEQPFTPNSFRAERQTNYGTDFVPPLIIGNSVLFVRSGRQEVRDMGFELQSDSFVSEDMTILSRHLFEDTRIKEWASARLPNDLIYLVMDDGTGLMFTYMRERQSDVFAWSRLITDGNFKSTATIREDDVQGVYFVVERTANNQTVKFIERLHERDFDVVEDAFFVDAGLTYDNPVSISDITQADPGVVTTSAAHGFSADDVVGISDVGGMVDLNRNQYVVKNPTSTTFELYDKDGNTVDTTGFDSYTSGGAVRLAIDTFSGLSHLEGRDVTILGDGNVLPTKTVSDGQITLDRKYSRIHVGLPYESILETRGVDAGSEQSIGRKGSVKMLKLRVLKSRGYEVGPDRDNTREIKERQFEALGDPISLQTGIKKHTVQTKIKEDPKFAIKQANPLPLEILNAVVEVQFEGEG